MKREIEIFLSKYFFFLKKDKELSEKEKKQIHYLLIRTYPTPKSYYKNNRYYSTVKPQMNFLIKKDNELIGTGKFLWRNVKAKDKNIKLFAFGVVIAKKYQNKKLGTRLIQLSIKEAKQRKADLLYGSTSNLILKRIFNKLNFQKIETHVFYKNIKTKKIERDKNSAFGFEFKKGIIKKINKLPQFYIGNGRI